MNGNITTLLSLLIGTIITVNGIGVLADDIIKDTKSAVNGANIHQLATALELYYFKHQQYPNVNGGEDLSAKLEEEGYIKSKPADPSIFEYQVKNNGQEYDLVLK